MESHILTHSKLAGAFDAAGFSAAGVLISASAVGLPRYGGEGRREEGREEVEKERGRERESIPLCSFPLKDTSFGFLCEKTSSFVFRLLVEVLLL